MFFLLSKAFFFLLSPFVWICIAVGFHFYTRNPIWKKRTKWFAIVTFFVFTNSFLFFEFCRMWEVPGKTHESMGKYDVAIVLGGMSEYNNDIKTLSIRRSGDRLFQALRLYKEGKVKKIMISGDAGYLTDRGLKEAKRMKELLISWGVPAGDIITEELSKNTHENAEFSVKILKQRYPHFKSFVLVTSGMHMRRSIACFKKEGLNCIPFSTDLYAPRSRKLFWDQYFIPELSNLFNWHKLIKEWVGFVTYDAVGYL